MFSCSDIITLSPQCSYLLVLGGWLRVTIGGPRTTLVRRHWVHPADWGLAMWIAKDFLLYCVLIFAFAGMATMLVLLL